MLQQLDVAGYTQLHFPFLPIQLHRGIAEVLSITKLVVRRCITYFRPRPTGSFSGSSFCYDDCYAVGLNRIQQFPFCGVNEVSICFLTYKIFDPLYLYIGRRSLCSWRLKNAVETGADCKIAPPSVSVARSTDDPGAAVPGFQNCIVLATYTRVTVACASSNNWM